MTVQLIDTDRSCRTGAMVAPSLISDQACQTMIRREYGGVARADWLRMVFVHLEVEEAALRRSVPFELDLFHGRAFVSLVAFVMRRFRPRGTGIAGRVACAPFTRHGFLNVRTYVRHDDDPGIFFLTEWVNNPLAIALGPRAYGLPYRAARLRFDHNLNAGEIHGLVSPLARNCGTLKYHGWRLNDSGATHAREGSLEEFLLERYTAYTHTAGTKRCFRIWHEPWEFCQIHVNLEERSLLNHIGGSLGRGRLVSAQFSAGARDVWIGRPRVCRERSAT
jgi:uncharacterized protein